VAGENQGARPLQTPEVDSTGWGDRTYELRHYDTVMLVTIPHLSQHPIVGRSESQEAVDRIVSAVAEALGG
jgi:hypothetical protein